MKTRLFKETGTAIVTAISLMTVMMGVGLATYSLADTQQVQTKRERHRESTFNYSEGALGIQSFILSRRWPARPSSQFPDCSNTSAPAGFCPQPAQLASAYNTAEFTTGGTSWRTEVRDDVAGNYYNNTVRNSPLRYDANGNQRVWVRSDTVVKKKRQALVALVEIEQQIEELPQRVIIAGSFTLTPNGNHTYVRTNPDQTSNHQVSVRCDAPQEPSQSDPCMGFTPDRNRPQIDPPGTPQGYEGGQYVGRDAVGDDVKERLKERAIADNTYYDGCPSDTQLTGKIVWVANCANGRYTQGDWNTSSSPGMLVWEDGNLEMGGNATFWGIIYHLNNSNRGGKPCPLTLRGGLTVQGGIYVDGPGCVDVGSNKVNVNFVGNAFTSVSTYGSAGVVQNSFRQLPASVNDP